MIQWTVAREHDKRQKHMTRHDRQGWYETLGRMEWAFGRYGRELAMVSEEAGLVFQKLAAADAAIEKATAEVCPGCSAVCCVNRYGFYEPEDLIYILACGTRRNTCSMDIFTYTEDGLDPCRFLGEQGCSIARPLRPFRCNWFFCGPLMSAMRTGSEKEFRCFTALFNDIIQARTRMAELFYQISAHLANISTSGHTGTGVKIRAG